METENFRRICTHYCDGVEGNTVAFVFSCPGKEEEDHGRPVAGATGKNLDLLLEKLHNKRNDIFPFAVRYSYRITNSVSKPLYKTETNNRTEPYIREIKIPENLNRLRDDLAGISLVICSGKKAQKACENLGSTIKYIAIPHLGNRGLNSVAIDGFSDGISTSKKDLRIEKIAEKLLNSLG